MITHLHLIPLELCMIVWRLQSRITLKRQSQDTPREGTASLKSDNLNLFQKFAATTRQKFLIAQSLHIPSMQPRTECGPTWQKRKSSGNIFFSLLRSFSHKIGIKSSSSSKNQTSRWWKIFHARPSGVTWDRQADELHQAKISGENGNKMRLERLGQSRVT